MDDAQGAASVARQQTRLSSCWTAVLAELQPRRWQNITPDSIHLDGQRELEDLLLASVADSPAEAIGIVEVDAGEDRGLHPVEMVRADEWALQRGRPELAMPGIVTANGGLVVARVRWIPQNLYRANGFLLKLNADVAALAAACESEVVQFGWVLFVDVVGIVSPDRVARWRKRNPGVTVRGWSARWGDM